MRRFLSLVFAYAFAGQAWAQNFTIDNLNYEVTNASKKYVSVRKAEMEIKDSLVIPSEVVNDDITYTVVSIADRAFYGCSELISVDIPKSVSSIGRSAFYGCRGLTSIIIPAGSIYEDAFRDCTGLTSMVILNGNHIVKGAFSGCSNLTSITLPYHACEFEETDLNTYTRYYYPFGHIFGEIEYDGGEQVSQISYRYDYYYDVYFGNGYDESNKKVGESCTYYIPSKLKEIIITGSGDITTSIPDGAFSYCKSLTSVTIKGVTNIGQKAFKGCESLESLDISEPIRSIGVEAFYDCRNLMSITIRKAGSYVGRSAFAQCYNLTIYCEAQSKPANWHYEWNISNRPVVWGDRSFFCRKNGHTKVTDKAVAATCTVTGLSEGSHCDFCGEILVAQTIIPKVEHSVVVDAAVAATATETGLTEGSHCSVCGAVIVAQKVIPALGEQGGESTNLGTAVAELAADNLQVYAHHNTIIVENATDEIRVYDAMGRMIGGNAINRVRTEIPVNGTGVYVVKVGNVAKRVMVN